MPFPIDFYISILLSLSETLCEKVVKDDIGIITPNRLSVNLVCDFILFNKPKAKNN
jgi:hypothetical protein